MSKPLARFGLAYACALLCLLILQLAAGLPAQAQQQRAAVTSESRARGIELYRQGDIKGAIESLQAAVKEQKDDADAWFYLGLSLIDDNDARNARRAYETAVKLRPDFAPARAGIAYAFLLENKFPEAEREAARALKVDASNAEAHYVIGAVELKKNGYAKALAEAEAALQLNRSLAPALLLKTRALLGLSVKETFDKDDSTKPIDRWREAVRSLEHYLKLSPKAAGLEFWREQLEALYVFTRRDEKAGAPRTVIPGNEVDKRARILKREYPQYTQEARAAWFEGTITLMVVLGADAQVKNILVLESPGYGLTEGAIEATRRIKFEPAIKDGKPVSTTVIIDYHLKLG